MLSICSDRQLAKRQHGAVQRSAAFEADRGAAAQPHSRTNSPGAAMLLDAVRGGVASVSQTLAEFDAVREAGREGDELATARLLPWRTLGEQFSILEATLQERILRVSVVETFRPELARVQRPGEPKKILPGCLPMAQASLEADPALAALRYRLVPATLSEEECACHWSSNLDTQHTALVDIASALRDTGALTRRVLCAGSLALLLLVTWPSAAPDALRDACVTCH